MMIKLILQFVVIVVLKWTKQIVLIILIPFLWWCDFFFMIMLHNDDDNKTEWISNEMVHLSNWEIEQRMEHFSIVHLLIILVPILNDHRFWSVSWACLLFSHADYFSFCFLPMKIILNLARRWWEGGKDFCLNSLHFESFYIILSLSLLSSSSSLTLLIFLVFFSKLSISVLSLLIIMMIMIKVSSFLKSFLSLPFWYHSGFNIFKGWLHFQGRLMKLSLQLVIMLYWTELFQITSIWIKKVYNITKPNEYQLNLRFIMNLNW